MSPVALSQKLRPPSAGESAVSSQDGFLTEGCPVQYGSLACILLQSFAEIQPHPSLLSFHHMSPCLIVFHD